MHPPNYVWNGLVSNMNLVSYVKPLAIDSNARDWMNELLKELLDITKEIKSETQNKGVLTKRKTISKAGLQKAFMVLVKKYSLEMKEKEKEKVKDEKRKRRKKRKKIILCYA